MSHIEESEGINYYKGERRTSVAMTPTRAQNFDQKIKCDAKQIQETGKRAEQAAGVAGLGRPGQEIACAVAIGGLIAQQSNERWRD